MQILYSGEKALVCAVLGMLVHAGFLLRYMMQERRISPKACLLLLLPSLFGFLFAKGGYELLQAEETISSFRWCFTAGLGGMAAGTALSARLTGQKAGKMLDQTAPGFCIAMAFARFGQRWLGEVGTGPFLEDGTLLCRPPFVLINEWQEPLLAIFLIETLSALCAAVGSAACLKRRPGRNGNGQRRAEQTDGSCAAWTATMLLLPQILMEQFRTGHYMVWRMVRAEQVLCGAAVFLTLVWMCAAFFRKTAAPAGTAFWPCAVFVALTGCIAAVQFVLDGKLFDWPEMLCWVVYVAAVLGLTVLCRIAWKRLNA